MSILLAFLSGAELVIHNAAFDIAFLDAELARLPGEPRQVASVCQILDTLADEEAWRKRFAEKIDVLRRMEQDNDSGS